MYERSAIVLERYYTKILGLDQKVNLDTVCQNYQNLVEENKKHHTMIIEEDNIMNEFDEAANQIRKIQQEQKKIYEINVKLEENRNELFDSLDEKVETIEKKLSKIEEELNNNNLRLNELGKEFTKALENFNTKQEQRNKCSRDRRIEEKEYYEIIDKTKKDITSIEIEFIKGIKRFIQEENTNIKLEIKEKMINNGKNEKIPFDENVINVAIEAKNEIVKRKAEYYILIYERTKRLINEINGEEVKIEKHEKALRDFEAKTTFLNAQNNYITSFLDNERIMVINGKEAHKQLMEDACKNFEADMTQIENLYELIVKETTGKSTQKAYRELYNKEYLKNIEEKAKNFVKEISSININSNAIINSNYWRIEEIRNIYRTFIEEVSEKFGKDPHELQIEEENKTVEQHEPEFDEDLFIEDSEYIDEFENVDIDDKIENKSIGKESNKESKNDWIDEENQNNDDYVDDEDDEEYDSDYYDEDDNYYDEDEDDDDDDEYEYFEDDDEEFYEDDEVDEDNDEDNDEEDKIITSSIENSLNNNKKTQAKKGLFNKFFKD